MAEGSIVDGDMRSGWNIHGGILNGIQKKYLLDCIGESDFLEIDYYLKYYHQSLISRM